MFKTELINNEIVLITPPEYLLLNEFFEIDIQKSIEVCDYYFEIINNIKSGKIDKFNGVGNAFELFIDINYFSIINEYTGQSLTDIELKILIECLQVWKKALIKQSD